MRPDPIDVIQERVRACTFFNTHSFKWKQRTIRKISKNITRYILTFENRVTNRRIDVGYVPPQREGMMGSSTVMIGKAEEYDCFDIRDYIRQHHGQLTPDCWFDYSGYEGTFADRVDAFLEKTVDLLQTYALGILEGKEWPKVERDWYGHR